MKKEENILELKDLRLLFVEDDPFTQEMLKNLLLEEVKELYQAYDGEDGWNQFIEYRPDLVITDINMPEMSGLELARKIKTFDETLPILIISAHDEKEILLEAIDSQIDGYLLKPLDIEKLWKKIRDFASRIKKVEADKVAIRKKIKALEEKAYHDTVTGLPNRARFEKLLSETLRNADLRNETVALFLIDLDHFKTINDHYGHPTGDRALRTLANSMKRVLNENATLFRIGGDEFALIAHGRFSQESLQTLITDLTKASHCTLETKKHRIHIGCSIGVCTYPVPSRNRTELLEKTDQALYQAKSTGRGTARLCNLR